MKTLFFTGASGLVIGLSLMAVVAALHPTQPQPAARTSTPLQAAAVEPLPGEADHVIGGYSGTQFERELALAQQLEIVPNPAATQAQPGRALAPSKPKPGWTPPSGTWRWHEEASPAQFADIGARMASTANYTQSLQLMAGLAGKPRPVWQPRIAQGETRMEYMGEATRFATMPGELADVLFKAFNMARGCARQNIIFHAAQALPREFWRPWLSALWHGSDAADSEDALCALAFLGEPDAAESFEQLARQPAPINANRIVDTYEEHDALAQAGEREYLRSYRSIETLDGAPYFAKHGLASGRLNGLFPWRERAVGMPALVKRMLPLWLARYPGHPGSDDMLYRLSRLALAEGRNLEALELASRCATCPDQDMLRSGTSLLLFIAECVASRSEVEALLSRGHARNRNLLHYVRLRREAIEAGFGAALAQLRDLTDAEPDLDVSIAYGKCWAEEPCGGIDSGLAALANDDPLRQKRGSCAPWGDYSNPASGWYYRGRARLDAGEEWSKDRIYRHDPPAEAIEMEKRLLARQFRTWETLAELECRTRDENPAPDLAYKMAAVRYHNRALVPCYLNDYRCASGQPSARFACNHEQLAAFEDYCRRASRYLDAAACFDALWPAELNFELRAREIFSAGLSWIRAADTQAFIGMDRAECIRTGVDRFEQLARELPQSNLADDAAHAAQYWRRNYARLWNDSTVSGK